MDPNVALSTIRDRIATWMGPAVPASQMELADEIINLVDDLDDWLSKGGFPPQAWVIGPPWPDEVTTPAPGAPRRWVSPEGHEYGNPAAFAERGWAIGPEAIRRAVRHRSGEALYPLYPEQMVVRDARGVDRLVTFDEPLKVDTATANPPTDPAQPYTWTSRKGEMFANAAWFHRRGQLAPTKSVRSRSGRLLYPVPEEFRHLSDRGVVTVPAPSDPTADQHSPDDGQDSDTVPTLRPDDPAPPLTPGSVGRPAFPPSWSAEQFTLECIGAITSALQRIGGSHRHLDQRRRWERQLERLDVDLQQAVARYAPETPGSS